MIPKIIHYCWFGGNPLPVSIKRYIETWKKYCPDFEIKEWNENNFDVTQNEYCKEAFENGKWAFVSDYVRLSVLYRYGGIYLDTDVEILKNLESLLENKFFMGMESEHNISTAVIGAEKRCYLIKSLLSIYDNIHFIDKRKNIDYTTNVDRISRFMEKEYKIKLKNNFFVFENKCIIYPVDYFCAKNIFSNKIFITKNTYAIHHFSGSWLNCRGKIKNGIRIFLGRTLGEEFVKKIKSILNKF